MRIAGLLAVALLASSAPANAAKYPETKIGDWVLDGEGGVCTAGLLSGNMVLVLVSADGDNDGGIALITKAPTGTDGVRLDLDFTIDGQRETMAASYTAGPNGYWIPFGMSTNMPGLPDDGKLEVRDHGTLIFTASLGPVRKVVSTLRECDAQLARETGT